MSKYKLLTDGGYEEFGNCVGQELEGTRISDLSDLIQISRAELIRSGEKVDDDFDQYLFFLEKEVEEVIE
jgi:hypothetical protein